MKKELIWGIGIEAEFALFHDPKIKKNNELLFFDPQKSFDKPMQRFYYYFYKKKPPKNKSPMFFPKDVQKALDISTNIDVEQAGKTCKGKVVVGDNNDYIYYLLEARTTEPFSGEEYGIKKIENYVKQLQKKIKDFIKTYTKYRPEYQLKENKIYGKPAIFPYGMSSRIRLRNLNTNKFSNGPLIENYTGSYHFTFTWPHTFPTNCDENAINNKYFANLIQWIEPLIATAYHSCDDRAIGNGNKYTKGSFRMVMASWGNFGGSDIKKIKCAKGKTESNRERKTLGRYSNQKVEWRNDLPFKNIHLLEPCRNEVKAITLSEGMGGDFRTPYLRLEYNKKMSYIQGIEVRIFDWFDPKHLMELAKLMIYVAERSRVFRKDKFVHRNKAWNDAVREVMINGWNAVLNREYVDELCEVFGFNFDPRNMTAYGIFEGFVRKLYEVTKSGKWANLMLKDRKPVKLAKVNRESWENAFDIYLEENKGFQKKLELFEKNIKKGIIDKKFFGKNWENNFYDILAYLESQNKIKIKYNYNGSIQKIY